LALDNCKFQYFNATCIFGTIYGYFVAKMSESCNSFVKIFVNTESEKSQCASHTFMNFSWSIILALWGMQITFLQQSCVWKISIWYLYQIYVQSILVELFFSAVFKQQRVQKPDQITPKFSTSYIIMKSSIECFQIRLKVGLQLWVHFK